MSVDYSLTCINNRLQAVVNTIDGGGSNGNLLVRAGATTLVSIQLARPCGTVSGGVLTFVGTLQGTATATGSATNCVIQDSTGSNVVTGLSIGIPFSGADVIMDNGLNSTLINSGQTALLLSATITGS